MSEGWENAERRAGDVRCRTGMRVRDAMTEQVLTITPARTLREAAEFLCEHKVGAAVIIDPEQPGPGIITERDLVRSLGQGEDPDT